MQTMTESFFKQELLSRRQRLENAIEHSTAGPQLQELLEAVDSALDRLQGGTFGICEVCHDPIEEDRLLADPLIQVCIDHLTPVQRRALEEDLALASRVQRRLLPGRDLSLDGWQVSHHFDPAGAVSGDYCDLVGADSDGGFYFFLGDVSGKGVSASLLMSHLHAVFRSLVSGDLGLDQLMNQANHLFSESTISSHYATLVAGRARPDGGIELSNAGHCPVLAVHGGNIRRIDSTGLPIGLFSQSKYSVQKVQLDAGDSLFLFTDGIIEALNGSDEEYGLDRLSRLIAQHAGDQLGDFLGVFRSNFESFRSGTPKHDDVTLMILRRTG